MADRLAEKSAMRRHRAAVRIGWWVLGVVVAAGLGWVAFVSPVLALDAHDVNITGQGSTIDGDDVYDVVARSAGVPLPRLDTVGIRDEILTLNAVKDVRITRDWPRGLGVALTAREPVAAVPHGGKYELVDPEGVVVAKKNAKPKGLPVVDVPTGKDSAPVLSAALYVLAGLPDHLADDVTKVKATTRDDVRTTLNSGQEIRWGGAHEMALKVEVVDTLRHADKKATVIDVSSPELPITR